MENWLNICRGVLKYVLNYTTKCPCKPKGSTRPLSLPIRNLYGLEQEHTLFDHFVLLREFSEIAAWMMRNEFVISPFLIPFSPRGVKRILIAPTQIRTKNLVKLTLEMTGKVFPHMHHFLAHSFETIQEAGGSLRITKSLAAERMQRNWNTISTNSTDPLYWASYNISM